MHDLYLSPRKYKILLLPYPCNCLIGPVKQIYKCKIVIIIFLSISLNMCFGCSKEPSHRDGSFEYPQHMFG